MGARLLFDVMTIAAELLGVGLVVTSVIGLQIVLRIRADAVLAPAVAAASPVEEETARTLPRAA